MRTHNEVETKDPKLFRLVDENGDWSHYVFYQGKNKKYLRAVNYILSEGYAKGKFFEDYLRKGNSADLERNLKDAGEKGDNVHRMISKLIEEGKINRETKIWSDEANEEITLRNDEWKCLISAAHFFNVHELAVIDYEFPVYNLKHGYAGTADLQAILKKCCENRHCKCKDYIGKIGLFDWKTGGLWDYYGPQLGAYAGATGVKVEFTAVVRIGTDHTTTNGYQFVPYDLLETKVHQKEFLSAMNIHDAKYKKFTEEDIFEIPDELSINGKDTKLFNPQSADGVENRKVKNNK